MIINKTFLPGVRLIELQQHRDERGWFMRTFCEDTFAAAGLCTHWPQNNQTLTHRRGAIRGMHWQAQPKTEIKLIRCSSGRVWDCLLDIRRDSPTFAHWEAFELSADTPTMLYVPEGIAHGFQCLEDHSGLHYMMSQSYEADLARGVRFDDPALQINWPLAATDISERDKTLPTLDEHQADPLTLSWPLNSD